MFKFIKTKDKNNELERTNIEITIDDDDIDISELLDEFKRFLLAVGFSFDPCSTLEVVGDNEHIAKNDYGGENEVG